MNTTYQAVYLQDAYLSGEYFRGYAAADLAMQVDRAVGESFTALGQAEVRIDARLAVATQVSRETSGSTLLASQASRALQGTSYALASEVDRQITPAVGLAMEAESGRLKQGSCSHLGYGLTPYLEVPYLTDFVCASLGMQVERRPAVIKPTLAEVDRKVLDAPTSKLAQSKRGINAKKSTCMQVQRLTGKVTRMQVRKVLYNTFNLRILADFPSRGSSGSNWRLISGTQMLGDFSVNNVNTDTVEQVFRAQGPQGTTNIQILCDTELSNGVYVDTLAILNHNLRATGSVQVEASKTESFSNPMSFTIMPNATPNMFWVSPSLPLEAYKYWRFTFNDNGNPDGYLQVGTIVFGSALIFQGENCVDTIIRTPRHFADKVQTEGFTNVSNDRALRYALGLEFRSLDYTRENYAILQSVFSYCRTSLKAVWVPTPRTPERFAVFGKLTALPSEQHNSKGDDADYVSFTLEVDESL